MDDVSTRSPVRDLESRGRAITTAYSVSARKRIYTWLAANKIK